MKYLLAILLLTNIASFAQNHSTQIAQFRKGYMADFLTDKDSPLKQSDLQYLRFYDVDSTYRVEARSEIISNPNTFIMPTFTGRGQQYVPYARLTFTLKGKIRVLTVYRNTAFANIPQYKDMLFLPFTDDTNGKYTYHGGRYIDMRDGDFKTSTVIIDFNKAYNPYCAYSSNYSCPKPPSENNLATTIEAGEKTYGKAH